MDTLIDFKPKTAEQKLLFSDYAIKEYKNQIKELSLENGMLKSELDEIKYEYKKTEKGALILKTRTQADLINDLTEKLRKIKIDNDRLMQKVINYQLNK